MNVFPLQQLANGRIIVYSEAAIMQGDRKVQVSEKPTNPSGREGIPRKFNIYDGFWELLNEVQVGLGGKELVPVVERMLEIKPEFGAIDGGPFPAAFGELGAGAAESHGSHCRG